jgi:hypothetical protein
MLPATSAVAHAVGAAKLQVPPLDEELLDDEVPPLLDEEEELLLDEDEEELLLLDEEELLLDEELELLLLDELRPPPAPSPPYPPAVSSVAPLAQARSAAQPEASRKWVMRTRSSYARWAPVQSGRSGRSPVL